MKNLLPGLLFFAAVANANMLWAWDGFDADSADLVEIIPDLVPDPGDKVTVKNHDHDQLDLCLVESIKRNSRTIEIVASCPDGRLHTLVMEGR